MKNGEEKNMDITDKTYALYTSYESDKEEIIKKEKNASKDWKIGDIILDFYEIKSILGEGAFGKVYRVLHRGWNRLLAVKTLKEELAEKESQNFIKECEGWVNLGLHPNVVTAYYVRSIGGLPRIFLEYIEGGDLSRQIKEGRLKGWHEILDLAIQCLDGLSFAHSKGLIHRDIKPLNCLLTGGGILKITDFGIAKGLTGLNITSKEDLSGEIIITDGESAGTPAYMPPEQWSSQYGPTGQWSDIYSFGIMLYEMCCRRKPFGEEGLSVMAFKAHHLTVEPPHPLEFNKDIPEVLSDFILKCLKKKSQERFQKSKDARAELAGIYKIITGKFYSRKSPEEIELRADSLNNRAVSLIDLGKTEDGLNIWKEALNIESHHGESVYNSSLILWRSGRKGDDDALSLLEEAGKSVKDRGKINYFLSLIHMERGDYRKALELLENADREKTVYLELAKKLSLSAQGCINTLSGHTKEIVSLSLSEDGRFLVSGGRDNTLKLWDLSSGMIIRTFSGHSNRVIGVSIDGKGKKILSASLDDTLRLWDGDTGQCIRVFQEKLQVNCISLSENGLFAVSGQEYGSVKLWDTAGGICLKTLEGHSERIQSVSISPDGKKALSGSYDRTIKLWDLEKGISIKTLEGHTDKINSVFLRDKSAISGSKDKTIRLWDIDTGICTKIFPTFFVNSVSLSPDGKWALSGDDNCAVKLWDVSSGRCIRTFDGHKEFVISVLFGKDGKTAVSGSYDRTIKIWDISLYKENKLSFYAPLMLCQIKGTEESAGAQTEFSLLMKEGKKAFSEGKYKEVLTLLARARAIEGYERDGEALELWNNAGHYMKRKDLKGAWEEKSTGGSVSISSLALSMDGKTCVSGGSDKNLTLWTLPAFTSEILEGHTEEAHYVSITSNGKLACSAGNDGIIRLWDLSLKKCITSIQMPNIFSVTISPDGKWAAAGGDRTIKLFDLPSGRNIRDFTGHTGMVQALSISTDGKKLLSGSNDREERLRLWDMTTGACLKSFHTFYVNDVALSFCGNYGLSGCAEAMDKSEKTLILWDLNSGKALQDFGDFREDVRSAAISQDGKLAVSGGKDYKVRLWDIASGKCLRVLEGHKDMVTSVAISSDCRWVLSGSRDRTIKVWHLDWNFEDCEVKYRLWRGDLDIKNFPVINIEEDVNKRDGEWKTPVIRAVEKGDISEVKNLLEKGADQTLGDRFGITPLHRASMKNRTDIVQLLLENRGKVDMEDGDGSSPLHWAKGSEVAELLIKKGADVNKRDKREQTPLIMSAMAGSVEVIKILVTYGGDINGKDKTGNTPLHWAVSSKQPEALKLLLSLGADFFIKDILNRTPLELAEYYDNKECVSIIKEFVSKNSAAGKSISSVKTSADVKEKLCDVCNKPLSGKEGTLYKPDDFRNIVSQGFEPADSFISMMEKLGLKRETIIKQWKEQTVIQSVSDWLLCSVCAGKAGQYDVTSPSAVPCNLKQVNHLRTIGGRFTPDMLMGGIALGTLFGSSDPETQLHRLVSSASSDKDREGLNVLLSGFQSHISDIYSVALSHDGKKILSGSVDMTVKLWDADRGILLKNFTGHSFNVYSVVLSNDGRFALSACGDKTLKIWDVSTGLCIKTLNHSDQVHSVAISSDGKKALSGSFDTTLKLWDIPSGNCLKTLEGHTNRVYSVALSDDGTIALSGSHDNTVRLWDLVSGKCLKVFNNHSDNVECVAISPDGHIGASGSRDCTIRVWDLKKQTCMKVLKGHTATVSSVFIDSYGKWLVSGCSNTTELPGHKSDKTIKIWHIPDGRCVKTFEGNSKKVYSAVMSRDGKRLVSGGSDKSINVWDLEWEYKQESRDSWISRMFGFFKKK
jgi:WD40 repeat protein